MSLTLYQFLKDFLANNPHEHSIERNWQQFKDTFLKVAEKYVLHKVNNPYKNLPCLNRNIIQMKESKCLYDQVKYSQSPHHREAYKSSE